MTNKSKDDCYIDLNPIKLNLNLQKAKLLLNKSEHLEGVDKKDKRKAVLRIRIRKILASWIRIRKNMRIHGSYINKKLQTNIYSQTPNLNYKKERL